MKKNELDEKVIPPITRRKATRGKHVSLHGYWKGIAATFTNKADRRHYLNMMLDATVSEKEGKERARRSKETQAEE